MALLRSPLFVLGVLISGVSGFFHFVLFLLSSAGGSDNTYLDILYFVLFPTAFLSGVVLAWWGRRRVRKKQRKAEAERGEPIPVAPLGFAALAGTGIISFGILAFTGYSSYAVFHYSESVGFCGAACHTPMGPTLAAYELSSHHKIDCVACHVGDGARGFVEAKIAGTVQLIEQLCNSFPRPILAPRSKTNVPAEACQKCHSPENSSHFRLEFRTAVASDEQNTFRPLFMTLKTISPREVIQTESFHWHRGQVEYSAMTEKAHEIPWVRVTGKNGTKVYRSDGAPPGADPPGPVHAMQCIDCHNRVGHHFRSPDEVVNQLFATGKLDYTLPHLKREAAAALATPYESSERARAGIEARIRDFYTRNHRDLASKREKTIDQQVSTLLKAFEKNLFPEMRADWRSYPDHSQHWYSPGCFRCHDGRHVAADGSRISNDCTLCHSFYEEAEQDGAKVYIEGQYKHPFDLEKVGHSRYPCSSCHRGSGSLSADCVECHEQLAIAAPPK